MHIYRSPHPENNSEHNSSDLEARETIDEPATALSAPVVQAEWGSLKPCNPMQPLEALQDEGTTTSDRDRVLLKARGRELFIYVYFLPNTLLPLNTLKTKSYFNA
jgi:hypothetical protein